MVGCLAGGECGLFTRHGCNTSSLLTAGQTIQQAVISKYKHTAKPMFANQKHCLVTHFSLISFHFITLKMISLRFSKNSSNICKLFIEKSNHLRMPPKFSFYPLLSVKPINTLSGQNRPDDLGNILLMKAFY